MKKHLTLALALLTVLCTSTHAQLPSYLPADGLVGWWPFNGNANDESGNGNDGVVNGAVMTEDRFGSAENAYSFNGTSNYIEVANSASLSLTNNFSFSCWIKISDYSLNSSGLVERTVIGKQRSNNEPTFNFIAVNPWGPNAYSFGLNDGPNNIVVNNGESILLNNWSHIVGTYDGAIAKLWKNGILVAFQDTEISLIISNEPFYFGKEFNTLGRFFKGLIDDIAIYNRALTEQEIQNLFTGTNTTTDSGDGAAPLPQGIPYQAAARDANGQPVVDSPVNVRFSLREGAADGAASYIESHGLTTNSIGLFNTVFGIGTPVQSAFDSINWAATTKFLQVEVDLGNGYVDMGTTQLLSVPYAFRSAQAANIKNAALPIYPDNTAALAGGLVAGEMYRTATGDLKIVY